MKNELNRRAWLAALVAAATLTSTAGLVSAAELVTAELQGDVNDVTVTQGQSANFAISLSATGNAACGSTHTAKVHAQYDVGATGAVTSNTLSDGKAFSAPGTGTNCAITWSGAPTPHTVAASVTAASTTPVGTYSVVLKESNGNTSTTSTNSSGGKLDDTDGTTITFRVVAPTVTTPPDPCAGASTPDAPVIASDPAVANGSNGWFNNAAPTLSSQTASEWATQPDGGTKSAYSASVPTLTDGITTVFATASNACRTSAETSRQFKVDTVAPAVDLGAFVSGTLGSNGWYTSAVTHSFTASDATSGLASASPFNRSSGTREGLSVKIASGSVSDNAGNTNSGIETAAYRIDLSDPTNVQFVGGPATSGSFYFGSVPGAPTCTADDAISGIASCVVTGYSSGVGSHTLTATATDNAGRTETATRSYVVQAWTKSGFYSPVDLNGVVNTVKGGATVPLKFEVFADVELTNTSAVSGIQFAEFACDTGAPSDAIETTATGGTSLRYDTTAGQFVYNWQTPKTTGKCYRTTVTLADGGTMSALFKTK